MTDKKRNIVTSLLFLAFGVFLFVQSMGIKHMMKNDVGSGFFPKVVGVAMVVVSIVRLVMALRETEGEAKKSDSDMKGGLETIILIAAYVLAFNAAGFLISTAVFLFLEMLVLTPAEKRNIPLLLVISIVAPIAIYALFTYAISSPLPKGILYF